MKSLQTQKGSLSPLAFHSFHTFLEHLLGARHSARASPLPSQTSLVRWEDKRQGPLRMDTRGDGQGGRKGHLS